MTVVSVSLPEELVAELDVAIAKGGYKGRSEYLRAALRHFLLDAVRTEGEHHVHGSITVVYRGGDDTPVARVRHQYQDVVQSVMHGHCEPTLCMDMVVVGGPADRVQALQDDLERLREVHRCRLVLVD